MKNMFIYVRVNNLKNNCIDYLMQNINIYDNAQKSYFDKVFNDEIMDIKISESYVIESAGYVVTNRIMN